MTLSRLRSLLFLGIAMFGLLGAINPYPPPVVVVYPLTVGGGGDAEAGANLAVLLSTKLGEGGGIVVKPATPGTARKDFLKAAIALGADYYVTGFLTPLGADTSLIAQVVSTYSGSVVYSTTAIVRTYGDAVEQADVLRQAILTHAGRGLGNYDLPESYPSATSEPSKGQSNQANLSQVFSRRRRAEPAPTPSPQPAVGLGQAARVPPGAARWLVATATGSAPEAERSSAVNAIVVALRGYGIDAAYLPVSPSDVPLHAAQLCAANPRTSRIFVVTLSLVAAPPNLPATKQSYTRSAQALGYDCAGKEVVSQQAWGGEGRGPVDAAAVARLMTNEAQLLVHPPRSANSSPAATRR